MRERVREACARLGYVPNRLAQSLKRGRTYVLGVVLPYCADSYLASLLDAIGEEAGECGYQLEVHFHRWSTVEEDRILRYLGESRVEGVILCGARVSYAGVDAVKQLDSQGIPIVSLGRFLSPEFACSVLVDRKGGAYKLGVHLGQMGHRRVDYFEPVLNEEESSTLAFQMDHVVTPMQKGICEALPDAKVRFVETPAEYVLSRKEITSHGVSVATVDEAVDAALEAYLDQKSDATAVVMQNSFQTGKLLAAMRRRGIRCPEDISVANVYCDERSGGLGAIPLTCAEFSSGVRARKAVMAVLSGQSAKGSSRVISVPMRVVVRDSVRALAPEPAPPRGKKAPARRGRAASVS